MKRNTMKRSIKTNPKEKPSCDLKFMLREKNCSKAMCNEREDNLANIVFK
jgi:hypothetical protein